MSRSLIEKLRAFETIKRIVPTWLKNWIKEVLLGEVVVHVIELDEAFPDLQKECLIPAESMSTPETKHITFFKDADFLHEDTIQTAEGYTTVVRDALYCPTNSVLLSHDRQVVAESLNTEVPLYPFEREALTVSEVEEISGCCTTFRSYRDNYYHTLIDNLPRLDMLCTSRYAGYEQIKLLCAGGLSPVEKFFVDKLAPENVSVVEVEEGRLYAVEYFIFNSFLTKHAFAGYLPRPYLRRFRSKVLPDRGPRRNRRIYISRTKADKRRIRNHEALLHLLQRFGFQEYRLEDMSIQEQIELFYDSEMVVSPHGAGLSNLLFSGGQIQVVELFPAPQVVPHYFYMCKMLGHSYHYLLGREDHRNDDFDVDVQEMRQLLEHLDCSQRSMSVVPPLPARDGVERSIRSTC